MNKTIWQKIQPHALAIGIFLVVSCLYCLPVLKGLKLNQHDSINWRQLSQHSVEFKEKFGHYPLWSNSMFSGMPAYQIMMESKYNVTIAHLGKVFTLFLPEPISLFFLACVGFYILCCAMGVRTWVAVIGALAYSYASYSAACVTAGHVTKFASMGYAPALIAGIILLTQRKYVIGFLATLLFTTLLVYQSHPQIDYYTFLIVAFIGIAFAIKTIREKQVKHLLTTGVLAVIGIAMGVASFAMVLMPTAEFTKESMRGGRSQLTDTTHSNNKTKGGLDKDYAFNWSYGIGETFTAIVPSIYGGSSPSLHNSEIGEGSKTAEVLQEKTRMPEDQAVDFARQLSAYWGAQPSTSGPVYFGAIICCLFILGLVIYREWHLGWIIAATVFSILLSWGKNFSSLNYFLFDHLPLYSKFRAPAMSLVIAQITIPLLAVLALDRLITLKEAGAITWKKLKWAVYFSAAVFVILIGLYFTLDYKSPSDTQVKENLSNMMVQQMAQGAQPSPEIQQQANDFGRSVVTALQADRRSLYGTDLVRSIVLVALAAGLLFLFVRNKASVLVTLVLLTALNLFDLLGVDLRYLSHANYEEEELVNDILPTRADQQIKQDTGYYRVLDQASGSPFFSSRASYFHNSVGGQVPARLGLYDDLINHQLMQGNMQVYNMLNTKYIIINNPQDRQTIAQQNPDALGAAWLVKSIKIVNNADEEMKALDTFNPRDTAIADKSEQSKTGPAPQYDSAASISLVKNLNDKITYSFNAATNQFAVFSEIYYPSGWKALIDGKETPIVKVNYALRGLPVPAGKHTIEFLFEPASYKQGNIISLIIGLVSILLLIGGIAYEWKQYQKKPARA
jgi:Bacterial membrane protein YfhO